MLCQIHLQHSHLDLKRHISNIISNNKSKYICMNLSERICLLEIPSAVTGSVGKVLILAITSLSSVTRLMTAHTSTNPLASITIARTDGCRASSPTAKG